MLSFRTEEIEVYAIGMCYMSVCAPVEFTVDDIELIVNMRHPTSMDRKWMLSADAVYVYDRPNPCPCDANPLTKKHYLLDC